RMYARNFQFGVAYSWSKTMDYANDDSSDVFFGRPYRAFNYGPADFDQTQIFTVNYIWTLPSLSKFVDKSVVRAVFNNWRLSGIIASDLSLTKTIQIKEGKSVEFRWEAYNLLNHNNFKSIDTSLTFDATGKQTNNNFGAPTDTLSPRVMQASLRLSF